MYFSSYMPVLCSCSIWGCQIITFLVKVCWHYLVLPVISHQPCILTIVYIIGFQCNIHPIFHIVCFVHLKLTCFYWFWFYVGLTVEWRRGCSHAGAEWGIPGPQPEGVVRWGGGRDHVPLWGEHVLCGSWYLGLQGRLEMGAPTSAGKQTSRRQICFIAIFYQLFDFIICIKR